MDPVSGSQWWSLSTAHWCHIPLTSPWSPVSRTRCLLFSEWLWKLIRACHTIASQSTFLILIHNFLSTHFPEEWLIINLKYTVHSSDDNRLVWDAPDNLPLISLHMTPSRGPGGVSTVSTVQASLRTGGRSLPRSPRSLVSVQLVEIIKELSHQIFSLPCLVSALCLHICIGNSIFTFHVTVKKTSSGSRNHSIDTSRTQTNAGPLEIKSRCHLLQTPDNDSMSQHLLAKLK